MPPSVTGRRLSKPRQAAPPDRPSPKLLHSSAHGAVQLANDDACKGAALGHYARALDHRRDLGDAPDEVLWAEDRGKPVARIDAVLQRHDHRIGADERLACFSGLLDAPELNAEKHHLHRPNLDDLVAGGEAPRPGLVTTTDRQSVGADGIEMGASGNERDLAPGFGQHGPETRPNGTGSDDRDTHSRPLGWSVSLAALALAYRLTAQ